MTRRWQSTGRFRRADPLVDVPLLRAAIDAKSAPHVQGNATRKAVHRARVLAKAEALRFEVAMVVGWWI